MAAAAEGAGPVVAPRAEPWEEQSRLPETALPRHYDLYINPDLQTKLFSGRVAIEINSTAPRDYFLLHTKWLAIEDTRLEEQQPDGSWQDVSLHDAFEYEPHEFWVVRTDEQVSAGLFRLSCNFSGSLIANGLVGFYYSDYVDENNETRILATTKFEPTYARQSFPCFDEPSFKSTYSVQVVRPSDGYIVLSNMPVQSETADQPSSGSTEVTFQESVPMVTYLVCFIVCDFTYIGDTLPSGLDFRVYAPRARVNNTQYALDSGAQILQYYETLFDLPFPLPKSDMAAIPDYVSGATEHWGIITFRETSIFYDPEQSSATNKQRVCSVVAHELAHQWFGNLVTLKWWDDLWLNEGFASYIEFKGVDNVHEDWDMEGQFCVRRLQYVFNVDSQMSSHPIVKTVLTPDQITGMFDVISYLKGSSVLRMLEGFVGTEVFQAGINSFLKRYAYQNAVTAQLWQELTQAWQEAGVDGDVGVIMGTWTEQMGYPVLTVTRSADNSSLVLSQQRFLQDPAAVSDPSDSPHGYLWHVPVSVVTSLAPTTPQNAWLYKQDDTVTIPLDSGVTWFKINYKQMGYYRVNYDLDTWASMAQLCIDKSLGPGDRASLYDDAFALADAGLLTYSASLDLSTSLSQEDHLVPWAVASSRLPRIIYLLLTTDVYDGFRAYVAGLSENTYLALGWQDEGDHLQQLLRVEVVSLACISGLESCLQESAQLLQSYAQDPDYPLPLGTKRQVLRRGMVLGGTDEVWQELWRRSVVMQDATQKDNLLYGLANSQDTDTLSNYITMSQDPINVRTQDFLHVLQYISYNPSGMDLVWDWVRANWDWLVDRYTLNDRYLGQLIPNISLYFATQEKLDEMEAFFALYPEAGAGEQYREQALETVKTNIRWVADNSQQIQDWLGARKTATAASSALPS